MPSDADQIRDLEEELDALDNPTTAEVLFHTRDYDAGIVAAIGVQRGTAGGGDGGSQPGEVLPVAVPDGATVDTTTYDNPFGPGKMTTLVFPADQPVLAIAIEGDAFPRYFITADGSGGIRLSDGTVDLGNTNCGIAGLPSGLLLEGPNGGNIVVGTTTVFRGASHVATLPLVLNDRTGISAGSGVPDALGGQENDLYIRGDAPDVNHYLYRCTVGGAAGDATWAPIGGLT